MPAVLISLVACEPANPPPQGFVEECYGSDFREFHAGKTAEYGFAVESFEEDWPDLKSKLMEFAEKKGLTTFDTSTYAKHIRTIELHVCSQDGLWIAADQRNWLEGPSVEPDPGNVRITVNTYSKQYDWAQLSEDLERFLVERGIRIVK